MFRDFIEKQIEQDFNFFAVYKMVYWGWKVLLMFCE